MHRAHLYRLYPTPEQEARLSQWVGVIRLVYNLALEQRQTYWRPGRSFNYVTQGRELSALRASEDWLGDCPRDPLDQALRDLDQAYRNWWDGRAQAPGYRCKGVNDAIRFPKPVDLGLRRTSKRGGRLKIPKLGEIAFRWDSGIRGSLKSVTIVRRAGKWFAACLSGWEAPEPTTSDLPPVGIDRGVTVFAALSTGELIAPTNVGKRALKSLAHAQRRLARKVKGSNNRWKQRLKVARLHMRVANARKNFLHQVSADIAKNQASSSSRISR